MAKRRGKEFFEVFKPENRPQGRGPGSSANLGDIPSVNRDFAPPAPAKPPASGGRPERGAAVSLSQSTAGVLALLMIVLLALSHAWGFYRGKAEREAPVGTVPADDAKVVAGAPDEAAPGETAPDQAAPGAAAGDGSYVLCIATYPSTELRDRLMTQLRERFGDQYNSKFRFYPINIDAGGRKLPAVGVGLVANRQSAEARQLQDEFRNMDFGRQSKPFSDAYFVSVKEK